jgi:hypothetical protein
MNESISSKSANFSAGGRNSVRFGRALLALFLLSLPLVNPIVHGDGVGYYAYARAPLIQHNLRFEEDWRHANLYFSQARTLPGGQLIPSQYTETGYVNNLFSIGPAMLWTPFLLAAHAIVLSANALGAHIPPNGFSTPYILAMALGTAIYGFLGLFFSYSLARKYLEERWAFLSTLAIWGATSLPVYMYFNPAWSHAHSAFAVAVFLWYWDRTRDRRTFLQWNLLGLLAGLMLDVYFPNGVFLLLPLIESILAYWNSLRAKDFRSVGPIFTANLSFTVAAILAFLPTLITRSIIFGGLFRFGSYTAVPWDWSAPNWRLVLFSSEHGLLSWTPILALALLGLFFPPRAARSVTLYLAVAAAAFYYVISSYPYWHGMASFGNRFFISLTPIFIFGLALLLQRFAQLFRSSLRAIAAAAALIVLFIAWNACFIFQWGSHLVPARGPISFSEMARNQFSVVPRQLSADLHSYFFRRKALMQQIEKRDIEQLDKNPSPP